MLCGTTDRPTNLDPDQTQPACHSTAVEPGRARHGTIIDRKKDTKAVWRHTARLSLLHTLVKVWNLYAGFLMFHNSLSICCCSCRLAAATAAFDLQLVVLVLTQLYETIIIGGVCRLWC